MKRRENEKQPLPTRIAFNEFLVEHRLLPFKNQRWAYDLIMDVWYSNRSTEEKRDLLLAVNERVLALVEELRVAVQNGENRTQELRDFIAAWEYLDMLFIGIILERREKEEQQAPSAR